MMIPEQPIIDVQIPSYNASPGDNALIIQTITNSDP